MRYLQEGFDAEMKPDHSPVTVADRECEALIRCALAREFPDDAVLGEEEGGSRERVKRRWIIDPIDGTVNYTRRLPIFATLLSLEEEGEIRLGVVHAPAVADTYWAERGGGAYKNGQRIYVSKIARLAQSIFNFGEITRILERRQDGFLRVVKSAYRNRGFGDYLSFAYVFEGKAEAALEMGLYPWDLGPMKVIVEEAGGRYSDLEGGSSIYSGACLVSNGLVHEEILELLETDSRRV